MDIETLVESLSRALSQSHTLLALAEAGDWDAFEVLVQEREQVLRLINDTEPLNLTTHAELESQTVQIIEEIQFINQRLSDLATANRDKLASDLRQSMKATKAIDAYSR